MKSLNRNAAKTVRLLGLGLLLSLLAACGQDHDDHGHGHDDGGHAHDESHAHDGEHAHDAPATEAYYADDETGSGDTASGDAPAQMESAMDAEMTDEHGHAHDDDAHHAH